MRNFQCHRETEIAFSPAITTIIGDSDVGKSAVLRALRWTLLNDFAGDDFIREGAKSVEVEVTVRDKSDDCLIRRCKGSENKYELGPTEFKAFGQTVPAEIAKLLRVTEMNFQGQFDEPFWFGLRGGEVSKQLNSIVDLSVIDTSLANVGKLVFRARERQRLAEEKLTESEKKLEELTFVPFRTKQFTTLKGLNEAADKRTEKIESLNVLLGSIETRQVERRKEQAKSASKLFSVALDAWNLQCRNDRLSSLINRLVEVVNVKYPPPFEPIKKQRMVWNTNVLKCQDLAGLIEDLGIAEKAAKAPPSFEPVQQKRDAFKAARSRRSDLDDIVEPLFDATVLAESAVRKSVLAKAAFKEETKGAGCPTCGQIIK